MFSDDAIFRCISQLGGGSQRYIVAPCGDVMRSVFALRSRNLLGSLVLAGMFGWIAPAAVAFLAGLNLLFSRLLKTRTAAGRLLEDQIEGFRLFLQSVDRLALDREDGPSPQGGIYERYLPYAVALEVEQTWGDRLVALSSTIHKNEALIAAHSFYLGMWNGKPVEMVFKPESLGH